MKTPDINEPLRSGRLLGLGLFVIESRSRHRDKSLGPWKPAAAFPLESNAVAYLNQYESIGYMRLRRPNAASEPHALKH